MRESFKKAKMKALWLIQHIQFRGWGEDYLGQLVSCFLWVFPHCYGKFPKEGVTESRSRHGDMSLEHNCRVVLLMPVMLLMSNNNCRVLFIFTIKHNNNDYNNNNSEIQSGTSGASYKPLMTTLVFRCNNVAHPHPYQF